jgi:hypothetical protein
VAAVVVVGEPNHPLLVDQLAVSVDQVAVLVAVAMAIKALKLKHRLKLRVRLKHAQVHNACAKVTNAKELDVLKQLNAAVLPVQ